VAVAIVAASRELGADPIRVASGDQNLSRPGVTFEISRARAYAALTLRRAFPDLRGPAIARMVGAHHRDVYMPNLVKAVDTGKHRWWSEAVLATVRAAVAEHMAPEPDRSPAGAPALSPAPKPVALAPRQPRPAATPGKRDLTQMLRDAVERTQAMTPKE